MIQSIVFFIFGVAATCVVLVLVGPLLWQRALFLGRRSVESELPVSLKEIEADRDYLRAKHAMEVARITHQRTGLVEQLTAQKVQYDRLQDKFLQLKKSKDELEEERLQTQHQLLQLQQQQKKQQRAARASSKDDDTQEPLESAALIEQTTEDATKAEKPIKKAPEQETTADTALSQAQAPKIVGFSLETIHATLPHTVDGGKGGRNKPLSPERAAAEDALKTGVAEVEYMLEKLSHKSRHSAKDVSQLQSMLQGLAVDMIADLATQEGEKSAIRKLVAVADDKKSLAFEIKQALAHKAK